jgi:hypothetical protein
LAAAVTEEHGEVIEPVSSLVQGLNMVAAGFIEAAILDVGL